MASTATSTAEHGDLQRGLRQRHMTMIAIGGVIGAGLFVGSGKVINDIGPASVITYLGTGGLIVLVMRMLGEMATADPDAGSFSELCRKSLGDWAGFAVGWLYWYFWVIVIAFEAVAGAKVLQRWVDAPLWAMSLGLLLLLTLSNVGSVRSYGEFEFWFAAIKVIAIVAFLGIGAVYVLGLWPGHSMDFSNLTQHGGFVPNGGLAMFSGVVTVVFSMVGAEIVTVAAAESDDPGHAIAKATNSVIVRILVFYVGSIFLIVSILPWNSTEVGASPYVGALAQIGIPGAADIMNGIVLTAVLSCLNSGIYTASRMIFALAKRGDAPESMLKVTKAGVPLRTILMATLVGYLSVGAAFLWPDTLFTFLLNSSGAVVLFVYLLIAVAELRMRKRIEAEVGRPKVRMWFYPWLTLFAIGCIVAILVSMGIRADTRSQLALSLLSAAVVLGLYLLRRRSTGRRTLRGEVAAREDERRRLAVETDLPGEKDRIVTLPDTDAARATVTASRVLVVANETVAADELMAELRGIQPPAGERDVAFHVAVPAVMTHVGDGRVWSPEPALASAHHRLRTTLDMLREHGLSADGTIRDSDPMHAIRDAVGDFHPDLIVISTHPHRYSVWLRDEVVDRTRHRYDIPVRHVVSHVPTSVTD